MSEKMVDPDIVEILSHISKNPKSSEYKISKNTGVNRITVRRKIKPLRKEKILKMEKGKRRSNLSSLTFKGILYALNIGAIKPDEAAEVRQRNEAQLPPRPIETQMYKLFGLTSTPLVSQKDLKDFERILISITPSADLILRDLKKKMQRMRSKIEVILSKWGRKESKLLRTVELRYSRQIYENLIKMVNMNFYEPIFIGYHFHSIMNLCFGDFFKKVFKERKTDAVKEYIDSFRNDPVEIEIQRTVFLPYVAEIPFLPKQIRDAFLHLAKASPDELCDKLKKLLERK